MKRLRQSHLSLLALVLALVGGGTCQLVAQENSYLLWTDGGNSNSPPQITSTPPPMVNRTYRYDVDATDADGDVITFTLHNAPEGMTIDTVTGLIRWAAAPDQIGTWTPTVTASDPHGGVSASQAIPLVVTEETFITATVKFYEGFDSEQGATEVDRTVLTFTPGSADTVEDIPWPPGVSELLTFSEAVQFYVEYVPSANGSILLRLTDNVEAAVIHDDTPGNPVYSDVTFATIADLGLTLTFWTDGQHVRGQDTVVLRLTSDSDTHYWKIGKFCLNTSEWTVSFTYETLNP